MSNRYPYGDMNPPPGIPGGYPHGPTPMPTSNPMYPTGPGFAPNAPAYPSAPYQTATNPAYPPASAFYPSTTSPYPSASPYPATTSPYPSNTSYPGTTSPYPSNTSYPGTTSPYPSNTSSYPSNTSPYPSATPPYSSPTSYPTATSNPSSSPYPPASSLYPSQTSPYPSTDSYPASSNSNPYPSSISPSSCYPPSSNSSHSSPYPNTQARAYPPVDTGVSYGTSGSSVPYQLSSSRGNHQNMAHMMNSEGTVKPYPNFDPKQDAEVLRKAMKGFGTDEKAIINVLAKRSNAQRVYIAVAYKQLFGKDLIDDLKSELSGNFEDVIIGLMTPLNDYLATEVRRSISGIGTDEDVLIEVLCTRTNQELWGINESYQRLYGKSMESDIKSDTSGHFQRLLVSTVTGARSEAPPDQGKAQQQAHALFAAGVGQWGTDESVFNSILVAESFQQLAHTFYEYQKLAGHTVAEAIDKEMSGDLKKGMLAIARSVENRPFYFAEKLYKAMKVGLGTDDRTLIRIVVSRCEVDMVQIKAEYERNYGKPLADAISGDTSGDYRRVLIALVNGY